MKKGIILLALAVLCCIPTVVAVASYNQTQSAPVDAKTATKVSIDDLNEKHFEFTKEQEGDEASKLIALFMQINRNASPISALPDSLTTEKCFKVTLSTTAKNETYLYYFSVDPTTNYYVAQDGKVYHIAEADAKEFITTHYAESLYKTSSLPVLTLSGAYSIVPDTAEWQYKNYTGEYVSSDVSAMVQSAEEEYELDSAFALAFDVVPDYFNVTITDASGNVIFDDFYGNLGFRSCPLV